MIPVGLCIPIALSMLILFPLTRQEPTKESSIHQVCQLLEEWDRTDLETFSPLEIAWRYEER